MYGSGAYGSVAYGSTPSPPTFSAAAASQRVWFLHGIESDAATLTTVGTELMPAANLQIPTPAMKWRLDGTSGGLQIGFPYPVAPNALIWSGHNHSSAGVIRLRSVVAGIDTDWRSAWPLGVKPQAKGWSNHTSILRWTNETLLEDWLFEMADPGAGLSFLQAGRFMMGREWQPRLNVDFGARRRITNTDVRRTSSWGAKTVASRPTGRALVLPFSTADEADAVDQAEEMQRVLGTSKDFVCALDPAPGPRFFRNVIHGRFAETSDFEPQPLWDGNGWKWSFSLTIEELTR